MVVRTSKKFPNSNETEASLQLLLLIKISSKDLIISGLVTSTQLILDEQPCLCLVNGLFLLQLWVYKWNVSLGKRNAFEVCEAFQNKDIIQLFFSPVRELEEHLK